jgi:hypothetical protein
MADLNRSLRPLNRGGRLNSNGSITGEESRYPDSCITFLICYFEHLLQLLNDAPNSTDYSL